MKITSSFSRRQCLGERAGSEIIEEVIFKRCISRMKEFDIDGLAIDAEKNKLLVDIYKIDDIKKNKVMEYIDSPFIEFRNCESRASFAPLIKQIY